MSPNDLPCESELVAQLRSLLLGIEASGRAVLPRSNDALLRSIVEAAARIFGAAAASIALVNEERRTLDFRVAYGAGNEQVVGMSIPLDKGIAGYVAMTGQPIAVSDVQRDARFAQDTAKSTGYVPRSILAMPLLAGERVIGVIEVLDKIAAPSFGLQDMELLGLFAQQAAIAIHQSAQLEQLGEALILGLQQLASGDEMAPLRHSLDQARPSSAQADETRELLELADRLREIAALGHAERQACLQVLAAFGEYARRKGSLPFRPLSGEGTAR